MPKHKNGMDFSRGVVSMYRRFISLCLSYLLITSVASAAQLQVGVFQEKDNLNQRTRTLESLGYEVRHQQTAGHLTRIRTRELSTSQLIELKKELERRDIEYAVIGDEPEPTYRKTGDTALPDLPAGLPPIRGYQRTLSDQLVKRLKSVMGTEYVWGAESPSDGFDCSGLLHWLFKRDLPRTVATMWPWVDKIQRDRLQPGDFVFFTFDSYKEPDHVGLYLGQGEFVHASSSYGVIKAKLSKNYYQQNLYGYGRPNF